MTDGWQRIDGGGAYVKWDKPGQMLEGVWRGFKDASMGRLGRLSQPDGSAVAFSITSSLRDLELVDVGATIRIVYVGLKKNKAGKDYKSFEVYRSAPEPF